MIRFGSADFLAHLSGNAYSDDADFRFAFAPPRQNRLSFLRDRCAGRRVLHIGCCDHLPHVPEKLAAGTWTHGILTDVASACLGVDIDSHAVAEVTRQSGLDNILAGDVTQPGLDAVLQHDWDVAVFGEVLEHIGNPVAFLSGFAAHYGAVVPEILVTVPNARRLRNQIDTLRQRERINSDHRFDFSPFTLSKVLHDGGYRVERLDLVTAGRPGLAKRLLLRLFPMLGDTLIATARQTGGQAPAQASPAP